MLFVIIGDCFIDVLLLAMLFRLFSLLLEVFLIFDADYYDHIEDLYGLFTLLNWLEVVLLVVLAAALNGFFSNL